MKIIHLGNVPVPTGHPENGCVVQPRGRWVLNHALAQKALGLDVEIVSQAHKASCDFDCEIEGLTVHFLRTFHPYRHFTFYALDSWRMAHFVRQLRPDVIHAHGTEAAYGHAAVRSGLPFCVTAQGLFFQIIPALGRSPTWNERFLRWGESQVWRNTKWAIAKSPYGVRALAKRFPHLDISLIYNTYDTQFDAPLKTKPPTRSVAFIGTMDERKGVHFLLPMFSEVLKKFPDIELHLVGNAKEGLGSDYERKHVGALRQLLGNRLVLHGKQPLEGVISVLDVCHMILAPSLEEMSGNQVTEGILRGCRAVVFAGTGVSSIARQVGNADIVPYKDVHACAMSIIDYFSRTNGNSEVISGRRNVQKLMSRTLVAELHEKLYGRILSTREDQLCHR